MRILSTLLGNFKIYSQHKIDLSAPLTLLVGPNSGGKSSIIKSLLGIKQSFSHTNEGEALASFGDYVDLGTFYDYVHNHNLNDEVSIGYEFDFESDTPSRSMIANAILHSAKEAVFNINFTFDFDYSTEQARIKKINFQIFSKKYNGPVFSILRKTTRSSYRLLLAKDFLESPFIQDVDFLLPSDQKNWLKEASIEHISRFQFVNSSSNYVTDDLIWLANETMSIFSRYFDREVFYIGPLRRSPSRSYIRTTHNVAVGPTGEHTPSVLASLEKRKNKVTRGTSRYKESSSLLQKWMNIIFPGKSLSAETADELVKLKLSYSTSAGDEIKNNISDVGFGVSQVIPILVQAAVCQPNNLIIIEQPELHLHPMAQSALAKIIADAILHGRRFIIETHSEHFIRGIQLAISEQTAYEKRIFGPSDVNTLYIAGDPVKIRSFKINPYGEYTKPWPSGFFDEAYKNAYSLMINKQKLSQGV